MGFTWAPLPTMESKKISSEIINAVQFASGRLFFVRDRSLMAQPFDLQRLELTGKAEVIAPEEIEEDPAFSNSGFSVSSNGVVVFQSAADNFSHSHGSTDKARISNPCRLPAIVIHLFRGMAVFSPLPRMTSTTEGILSESMTSLAVPVRWFPTAGPTRFRLYPMTARP